MESGAVAQRFLPTGFVIIIRLLTAGVCPAGVGFVKVLASVLLAAYYPIVMALSLFYGARAAVGGVPFPECGRSVVGYFVSID